MGIEEQRLNYLVAIVKANGRCHWFSLCCEDSGKMNLRLHSQKGLYPECTLAPKVPDRMFKHMKTSG